MTSKAKVMEKNIKKKREDSTRSTVAWEAAEMGKSKALPIPPLPFFINRPILHHFRKGIYHLYKFLLPQSKKDQRLQEENTETEEHRGKQRLQKFPIFAHKFISLHSLFFTNKNFRHYSLTFTPPPCRPITATTVAAELLLRFTPQASSPLHTKTS